MKYLKKTLSLLLCLIMVVGLLPMTAFAVEYTFTVSADPVEGGTVYIDEPGVTQVPADGSSYRAYAVANEGYKFIGWHNEHGTFLTNQKSCPFYPGDDSDMERIAKFEKIVTCTVTFDSNGGSAVTAQTVESGNKATKPADPTKEGYTFKGWTYKGSPYNFSKPVAENITLYARWGTEYNITAIPTPISGQSISSDDLDSYFPSSSSYKYINSTPVWDWYDSDVPSGVAVAGTNYYAYAIMYLEDYSAVPYEGDFVVKYAGTELSKISSTDIYKDNMKSGYRIYMYDTYNVALQVRVYLGTPTGAGNTYNIISGANGIYQKGSTADKLSFTADGNIADFIGVEVDGYLINVSDYNVESGSTIVELKKAYLESLSSGEHTLKIRYHDGEASTKFTVKDAAPTTYTVTFDSDGGSAVTAQTVESGKTATKPADPTREGYTFKGWTLDGAAYDFATPVTGNITLKAKWEAAAPIEYAIEVTLNGYSLGAKVADAYVSESSDTVDFYDFNADGTFFCIFEDDGAGQSDWGSTVTQFEADKDYWLVVALAKPGGDALPEAELDADNATLVNGCVDKFTVYDDDLWWVEFKLSRLSGALPDVYTITFDAAGGSVTPGSATTGNDGKLTSLPTPTHTNPSMAFDGWYTGKTGDIKVTTDTVFTSNTTVYAHWNVDYAIEVTLNGYELGKKVADTTLTENSDTLDIDRENCHIFTEEDGEPDWSSTVTEFEANKDYWLVIALTKQGGDALTSADLGADDVDLTNDYTKEQLVYDDDLWWVSYKLKRLDTSVPTIYAVTFDSDGGSAVTAQTVESGKPATKPADPTKEGYTFKGWYLGETAYDFATPVTGDITLKAKWEKIETPTDPTDPSKPTTPTTPTNPEIPKTGDNSNMFLWIALLFVSGAGIVTIIVVGKKRFFVK